MLIISHIYLKIKSHVYFMYSVLVTVNGNSNCFWSDVKAELMNMGFTGHTESGDSRGFFPSLPTSTVEVKSGDRTLWEVFHPD